MTPTDVLRSEPNRIERVSILSSRAIPEPIIDEIGTVAVALGPLTIPGRLRTEQADDRGEVVDLAASICPDAARDRADGRVGSESSVSCRKFGPLRADSHMMQLTSAGVKL